MASVEINLKCSDFLTNVFNSFSQLKSSDIFTDVTLVTDDNKQIQAHKIILSVGSEYFRNILSDKSHPYPMLCLDGVTSEDLAWIIQYLYVGEVSVPQSSLQKFLKIANKLKCHGLNDEIYQGTNMNKAEEELNSLPKFNEIQAQETLEVKEPLFINLKDYEYVEASDNNDSFSDDESINEESWRTQTSDQDPGATKAMKEDKLPHETSQFDKSQVQDTEEIEEPLFIKEDEHREAIDNSSEVDIKRRISTEAMTETVLGTKKLKSVPDFCRIEGNTFSMSQLKQFLKEIYHRNEDRSFSCNYCNTIQKGNSHMMEHAQIHVENLEFDCDTCGQIFKRTTELRSHKHYRCVQRQLNNQDNGCSNESNKSENNDFYFDEKKGIKKASEFKNIVAQTIVSMETSKKTLKRLSFPKYVIEPLIRARIIEFNGSISIKTLAERYQRKIKKMREEIRDSQEMFPRENEKHLVSESWGFGDLRVEISQGLQKIETLDKRNYCSSYD